MGFRKVKPASLPPETRRLKFSLLCLDRNNPKFEVSACSGAFWEAFFGQIERYSKFKLDAFMDQSTTEAQISRRHIVNLWNTEEKHFPIPKDAEGFGDDFGEDAWQFGLCEGDDHSPWRVHGFLVDDVFYVVWLDSEHKLFPNSKYNRVIP